MQTVQGQLLAANEKAEEEETARPLDELASDPALPSSSVSPHRFL